jgi:hypothetical protein
MLFMNYFLTMAEYRPKHVGYNIAHKRRINTILYCTQKVTVIIGLTGVVKKFRHYICETDLMSYNCFALRLDLFLPPGVSEFNR